MTGTLHLSDLFPDGTPSERGGGPAQVDAPPLAPDLASPAHLGELLTRSVRSHPGAGITWVQPGRPERFQPLAELLAQAQAILGGLRRAGLQPGEKVLFQMTDLPAFYSAFWGCVLGGLVPVPLALPSDFASNEGHGRKLHALWSRLEHPLILTDALHRRDLAHALTALDPVIRVVAAQEWAHREPDTERYQGAAEDPVLMLLTSGSTGIPKLVALSTRNVLGMIRGNLPLNGVGPGDTFLSWIPHEHVGAILYFHVFPIYLGCHQVHLPAQQVIADPVAWVESLARYPNAVSVAPNFLYGLLNERFEEIRLRGWDLSSVKVLINAGEPIVPRTARKFLRLFATLGLSPEVMCPSFGMSETCSAITWGKLDVEGTSDDDLFADVGTVIHGASLRIASEEGRVLPESADGRVQVKGPSVFAGYHANPEANRESFTEDGWLDTGDSGFLRGGRLFITGRNKNVIIVNGNNFYCHEIEAVIEELPEVRASYTAACACRPLGSDTDELAVFYVPAQGVAPLDEAVFEKIRRKVLRHVALNPKFLIPLAPEDVPKTSWGKIQHAVLKQRFHAGAFNPILREIDLRLGMRILEAPQKEPPRRTVEEILDLAAPAKTPAKIPAATGPAMAFSFLFFSDVREDLSDAEKYGLLRDLTGFADREGFTAVYLPERHFYEFGSIYANPAIVAAYLIPQTRRIRFRTAGVSLPLHHPAEVVEWWSMNDVLSGGRVDLGFGSGWNRADFVLSPQTYEQRRTVCSEQIPIVQKLWRGETVSFPGPGGEEVPITIYPRPIQKSLNVWLLISQNDEAFAHAGRQGYNVFTMLYGIHLQALEEKVALYRRGREEAGLDPKGGTVTLMLHTLIHRDVQTVREAVEKPFKEYVKSAFEAHARSVVHPGMKGMAEVGEKEKEKILGYAYERYFKTAALFGTIEEGRKIVEEAIRIGVDEIACLMDFGVDYSLVKDSLSYLKQMTSGYLGRSAGASGGGGGR